MFLWMRLHFDNHPAVGLHDVDSLELQLWELLAESGVLFAPGSIFSAGRESDQTEGYFRISFSQTTVNNIKPCVQTEVSSVTFLVVPGHENRHVGLGQSNHRFLSKSRLRTQD